MSQLIYFDNDFNLCAEKIASMNNVPKYCKNTNIVSKDELFEPLKLLMGYIPEDKREDFDKSKISINKVPFPIVPVSYNSEDKSITFKGLCYKKENKREVANLIGRSFSHYTAWPIASEFYVSSYENSSEKIKAVFSLDGEFIDLELFFGYLFEYLYLVEYERKVEIDAGLAINSQKFKENAFDIFISKYLYMFSCLAMKHVDRAKEYKKRLAKSGDQTNEYTFQDASSAIEDIDVSSVDSSIRVKFATFNKVLELIYLDLSYEQYQIFFAQCTKNQTIGSVQDKYKYDTLEQTFQTLCEKNDVKKKQWLQK